MNDTAETRVSWFRIFDDLKRRGWSVYRVKNRLRVAKSTAFGWKAGAEPKHTDGERLIGLWIEVTGNSRDDLPIERRYPSAHSR